MQFWLAVQKKIFIYKDLKGTWMKKFYIVLQFYT